MLRNLIYILIFLTSILSFSQNIKSITEFKKQGDSLVKNRLTEFNKNGNIIKEIRFGKRSNRIITTEFQNEQRVSELSCDYFKKKDTCVIRSYSTFELNPKTKIEKETFFESDSTIRFIREFRREKNIGYEKIHSWEFKPTKNPDLERAAIMTDTIFYDRKNREIKHLNYSSFYKKKVIEIIKYSKNKYTKQIIGTEKDTIFEYQINKLQAISYKNKIDYNFKSDENYNYEIEYW